MRLSSIAIAAALTGIATTAAADGKAVYAQRCAGCHSLSAASGPTGPSLKGVFGRRIAGAAGYAYSAGLKAKTGVWNAQNLDAYLANPAGFSAGSKMFFRLPDAADRTAVISYLKTVN